MNEITEDQFSAFEEVKASGVTNMIDAQKVAELTHDFLNRKQVLIILAHYHKLDEKYPLVKGSYSWTWHQCHDVL